MAQPTQDRPPEAARELLDRNIRKTVAISTLRKIRGLVDDYDREQRLNHRLSRRVLVTGTLIAGLLAIVILLTGGALPRLITAVLGWFKG